MKRVLSILLMIVVLFGGGYWFYTAFAGCDVPIAYRVGDVDSRFGMSTDEVRNAISSAESMWEDGTDRNLFTYDPHGELVVNFVYDERQANTKKQEALKEVLDQKENMSDSVREQYETLLAKYDSLRASYQAQASAYEDTLAVYNKEVADWNTRGGAPKDVYARLQKTQATLTAEEDRLNALSADLNTLVKRINALGSQGNSLVSDYNSLVSTYNSEYSEGKEFTQGEYQDRVINIYEFTTQSELTVVIAHELGHALGIEHVESNTAIMYHHMKDQILKNGLTATDREAFIARCGTSAPTMAETLQILKKTLLGMLATLQS